jgi:hypothetical protein
VAGIEATYNIIELLGHSCTIGGIQGGDAVVQTFLPGWSNPTRKGSFQSKRSSVTTSLKISILQFTIPTQALQLSAL